MKSFAEAKTLPRRAQLRLFAVNDWKKGKSFSREKVCCKNVRRMKEQGWSSFYQSESYVCSQIIYVYITISHMSSYGNIALYNRGLVHNEWLVHNPFSYLVREIPKQFVLDPLIT